MTPYSPLLKTSGTYTAEVMHGIQTKAETGIYEIRGYGTLRHGAGLPSTT